MTTAKRRLCLVAFVSIGRSTWPLWSRRNGGAQPQRDLCPIALAFLAGGPARAADVAAHGLIEAGHLTVDPNGRLSPSTAAQGADAAGLQPFRRTIAVPVRRAHLAKALAPRLDPLRDDLAGRGLVLSHQAMGRLRAVAAFVIGPVVILGIAKIVVGLARDKPVGFLVAMTIATSIAGLLIAHRGRIATAVPSPSSRTPTPARSGRPCHRTS